MSGFGNAHLNIFLCLLGFTMALDDSQAFHIRMQRESSLDNDQILGSSKSSQASDLEKQPKIDDHRKQHFKNPRKVRNKKRCFQGCPFGLEDTLSDCSRPWGWGPGPLYPEYGPHFHRGWAGHGSPFGCNNCGFGGPWRVPGCSCGCNNYGWRCCGQGGGEGNDCPQFNDDISSNGRPRHGGAPPLFNPFIGNQVNLKGPFKMGQGKKLQRRQDITYGTTPNYGYGWGNGYGWGQQSVDQDPYQGTYGNWQVPQQAQQTCPDCPLDKVVGSLFLWRPKGPTKPVMKGKPAKTGNQKPKMLV